MDQTRRFASHTALAVSKAALIALLIVSLAVGTALAGKGGAKGGGKPSGGGNSTIALVMVADENGNGTPNWHDTITFEIATTATASPYLSVTCFQNGTLVYGADAGFYADYPWPGARNMPLYSPAWTGGAADCTAVLNRKLATLRFHVGA
jgi:hypothetical protein